MKILFIAHEKDLNGASRSLLELIGCLQKEYDITVLSPYRKGLFIEKLKCLDIKILTLPYYKCIERKNIYLRWLLYKLRWIIWGNSTNKKTAKLVSKYICDNEIDIIHSNSSVVDIGIRVKKQTPVIHIMHLREFGNLDFNMFPFISYNKLFDRMNAGTDKFICVSKAICEHYSLLQAKKKVVIYNGVSQSNLLNKKRSYKNTINLIVAGRISKEKGQDVVIKAIQMLVDRNIKNIRLHLAGAGTISIPRGYEGYIECMGFIDEISKIRKNMDIEIVSSSAEAFGRVTVEAMLGGLVVIGSNSGGTPELIQAGKTGILFERGNPKDLADKIEFLIKNKKVMYNIAKAGQQYAMSNFYIERCSDEIKRLYDKLIPPIPKTNMDNRDY